MAVAPTWSSMGSCDDPNSYIERLHVLLLCVAYTTVICRHKRTPVIASVICVTAFRDEERNPSVCEKGKRTRTARSSFQHQRLRTKSEKASILAGFLGS